MHVLYLIDGLDLSGAEQALAAMAPHWVRRGLTLDVGWFYDRRGLEHRLEEAGATLFDLTGASGHGRRARRARALIRARRPDLVHTTLFDSDLAGRLGALFTGVPVVTSLVNMAYGPEQLAGNPSLQPWKLRAAQAVDALTARRVVRFHAITDQVAEVMGRRLRIPAGRIEVVPRGRDPERLGQPSPERRSRVRAALGIAEDRPVVLGAARHERQKGLDVLVDAFAQVRRSQPDALLLVAGREGNATAGLHQAVAGHGMADAVRFLGMRDDVADLMCACDTWVEPSRWEGGPGAMLEAMALAAPIVASDLSVYAGAVENAVSARLVPVGDANRLAEAVVDTLVDRAGAAERAERARQRFLERFTIGGVSDQMLGFYARALGESGSSLVPAQT